MRFIVKKTTKRWMVWDSQEGRVAAIDGQPAVDLSAETANWMAGELNAQHRRLG